MSNELRNWTFCDGMHIQDGIPQICVPDEWRLDWLDNEPFPGIAPGLVAYRPESVVVDMYSVSESDQAEFFWVDRGMGPESTRYAWKIFKGMAPMYAAASQEVHGLTVGQRYLFTMWTYADIVASYIDGKHFSKDVWAAEARAGVGRAGTGWDNPNTPAVQIEWGEWHNEFNDLLKFGEYRPVTVEFVAMATDVKVWFEVKAKWGLANNGWWLWGATLHKVEGGDPPTPIPPEPPAGVMEIGPESQAFIEAESDRVIRALSAPPPICPPCHPCPPSDLSLLPIVPLDMRDPQWAADSMGDTRYTLGGSGCAVVSANMLGTLVNRALRPDALNAWLSAHGGYTAAAELYWAKAAEGIGHGMQFLRYYDWVNGMADMATVYAALQEHGAVILAVDHRPGGEWNSHFVVALARVFLDGHDDLIICDPWDGRFKFLSQAYGFDGDWDLDRAIYKMAVFSWPGDTTPVPPPPGELLIGINDETAPNGSTGAEWLAAQGKPALVVKPCCLGNVARTLDYAVAAFAGVRVIANLRYSWSVDCGGQGTLPLPGSPEWYSFIAAAQDTIKNSSGVWGFSIGNEPNNSREWPDGGSILASVARQAYNEIATGVPADTRLAPAPLDPFNADSGDPREYLVALWTGLVKEPDFIAAHGYIRGPDAGLVGSSARFADHPLQWQFLNYPGCISALYSSLPFDFWNRLPVYVTEFNHLWRDGGEGDWGWVTDARASAVLFSAYGAALDEGFAGLAAYRWAGDAWRIYENDVVKDALAGLL